MEMARQKKRMLVVDDVRANREILCCIFEDDYDIAQAANGVEALRLMTRERADIAIVILDLMMPELDGFGVLRGMRENSELAAIPVVVVTAADDVDSSVKALELGAVDVLTKPFAVDVKIIRQRVRNIISRKEVDRLAEQNRIYAELARKADLDELTGLLNKSGFYRRVREKLDRHPDTRYVLVRWDLTRFKVFNELYGMKAGDELLRAVGKAKRAQYPESMCYARLEADHFAYIKPQKDVDVEEKLNALIEWFREYPLEFDYSPCIGIYEIDDPAIDVAFMCDRALLALQTVKGKYKKHYAFYDDRLRQKLLEEQEIINEMAPALAEGQFTVYLQPQIDFATGKLVGAESLVRWIHPTKGVVPPRAFISVFESKGFITQLDEYVWEHTCRLLRKWLDEGRKPVPVSVNLSRIDIYNVRLLDILTGLLKKYALPAELLRLEITETSYMSGAEQLISVVTQLREAGFTLEMDDFGSGYSSINTLKDVPVDVIKLDLRFLEETTNNDRSGLILSSVVRMADWLKLPMIAEGVETGRQAEYLKSIGCRFMQGYHFARPMPVAEYERYLAAAAAGSIAPEREEANLVNMVEFLNPQSQTALVFNAYVGAAIVFEYHNGALEALRVNKRYYREIGISYEQFDKVRSNFLERFVPETRIHFIEVLNRAIQTGEEQECETRSFDPGNGEKRISARVRLIARSDERYVFFCSIENITGKRELEQRAIAASQRLGTILASITCGVGMLALKNGAHRIVYANDMYYRLLGLSKERSEQAADDIFACVHPDDREELTRLAAGAHQTGRPFSHRFRCCRRDGSLIWLSLNASMTRIEGEARSVLLMVITDVTSERGAEELRHDRQCLSRGRDGVPGGRDERPHQQADRRGRALQRAGKIHDRLKTTMRADETVAQSNALGLERAEPQ